MESKWSLRSDNILYEENFFFQIPFFTFGKVVSFGFVIFHIVDSDFQTIALDLS